MPSSSAGGDAGGFEGMAWTVVVAVVTVVAIPGGIG